MCARRIRPGRSACGSDKRVVNQLHLAGGPGGPRGYFCLEKAWWDKIHKCTPVPAMRFSARREGGVMGPMLTTPRPLVTCEFARGASRHLESMDKVEVLAASWEGSDSMRPTIFGAARRSDYSLTRHSAHSRYREWIPRVSTSLTKANGCGGKMETRPNGNCAFSNCALLRFGSDERNRAPLTDLDGMGCASKERV